MIDYAEAKVLAAHELSRIEELSNVKIALLLDSTIEFDYGWMFFYQSVDYIQTGHFGDMIGGNAPIIVDRINASVHVTGTSKGSEFYLNKYIELRDDPDRFHREIRWCYDQSLFVMHGLLISKLLTYTPGAGYTSIPFTSTDYRLDNIQVLGLVSQEYGADVIQNTGYYPLGWSCQVGLIITLSTGMDSKAKRRILKFMVRVIAIEQPVYNFQVRGNNNCLVSRQEILVQNKNYMQEKNGSEFLNFHDSEIDIQEGWTVGFL